MVEFTDSQEPLRSSLLRAIDTIRGETTSLREMLRLIGEQGLLLLCALLSLPFLIPVSIPGVSTVFGAAIILLSLGIAFNRTPWIPQRILDKRLDAQRLTGALRKGAEIVEKIERYVKPRMLHLTSTALVNRVNGLAITLGGILLLFPLGLVPFSNTLPALAVLLLATGISQRDGMVVLAGYGMLAATIVYFGVLAGLAVFAGQGLASML